MLDRLLAIAAPARPETEGGRLRALRRFLLLYAAARSWLWLRFLEGPAAVTDPLVIGATAAALSVCAVLGFLPRTEHLAPRLALGLLGVQWIAVFPFADNHFYVELVSFGLLATASGEPDEDAPLLPALRIATALVLLHTGWQKLSYGHYLHGDYLAFMAATDDRFAALFGPLLGAEALESLRGLDPFRTGSGPWRPDSGLLVLASNAVVLVELVLPGLLLHPATRRFACPAAIGFVLLLQSGAHELGFALLFTNLLLLFAPADWNGRLLVPFAVLLAVALALAALPFSGLRPGML